MLEAVSGQAHNLKVGGSIPSTATNKWGYSSAGRAVALQAKGRRFDPVYLHQKMRGSYSGNTLAFQANAESSILLPRSTYGPCVMLILRSWQGFFYF